MRRADAIDGLKHLLHALGELKCAQIQAIEEKRHDAISAAYTAHRLEEIRQEFHKLIDVICRPDAEISW
jgi:hypothetical protein